ncbi:MAG: SPOR domain-containing protein [Spirochaetales bacterium]|nr:SPOR domain-containing protein [Spirochaetales bacterium]
MEQKKILWILLSVTLFLFIVSITGVVWFYPGRIAVAEDSTTSSDQERAAMDLDPVELLRNGDGFLGLIDSASDDEEGFSIIYGETEDGESVIEPVTEEITEEVIEDTTSTVASTPVIKQEPVKVVSTTTSVAAAPVPRKINVLEYWIQAASFSSRSRAESSSQALSEKGFSNLITIKTVGSDDYYRIRMGPYASKAEAEKFLGWVKVIDSYEKSYISQVYVQKTVN